MMVTATDYEAITFLSIIPILIGHNNHNPSVPVSTPTPTYIIELHILVLDYTQYISCLQLQST